MHAFSPHVLFALFALSFSPCNAFLFARRVVDFNRASADSSDPFIGAVTEATIANTKTSSDIMVFEKPDVSREIDLDLPSVGNLAKVQSLRHRDCPGYSSTAEGTSGRSDFLLQSTNVPMREIGS
jgi:hypothetical protein